ncbi:MAG: PEP-CTERM sorting domain-containing protein [Proteobacteria bacterium]|nr:PEP-CTERM sorting domain-containing protein [Pseudomonadota bacterium]MBU1710853.1 PEP-CTERM sorting domain-containing protein [Pseudomonadota bacterium]
MKRLAILLCATLVVISASGQAWATPMSGEYSITVTTTQIDTDTWNFVFEVSNINQQTVEKTGLDGFYIQIPKTALVTNVTAPGPYYGFPGYWDKFQSGSGSNYWAPEAQALDGYSWYGWWGQHPVSVYPANSTATFSIELDGVIPGINTGVAVTYWGFYTPPLKTVYTVDPHGYYSGYSSDFLMPMAAPVPEPCTILLFGTGLAGLALGRKRRKD